MFVCCVDALVSGVTFTHRSMVDVCVLCWCPCQRCDLHTEQWLMFVCGILMCLPAAWPSHIDQWLMFVCGMLMCLPAAWPSHRAVVDVCVWYVDVPSSSVTFTQSNGWCLYVVCWCAFQRRDLHTEGAHGPAVAEAAGRQAAGLPHALLRRARPHWPSVWPGLAPGETVGSRWDCGPQVRL